MYERSITRWFNFRIFKKQYAFSKPTKDNKKKYYDVFELINQGFYKIDDVKTYLNKRKSYSI